MAVQVRLPKSLQDMRAIVAERVGDITALLHEKNRQAKPGIVRASPLNGSSILSAKPNRAEESLLQEIMGRIETIPVAERTYG